MPEPVHIDPGETELLLPAEDTESYYANVTGASVQLGRSKLEARTDGRPAPAGDRGELESEPSEAVYAHNPDSNNAVAKVRLDHNGFWFRREARAIVGSVLTSSSNEASPANDEFVHRFGVGADPSAGITESFSAPDAADTVVVSVDDADDAFEVAVVFEDSDGNEITRRDKDNSGDYSGNSTTDVFVEAVIASEWVTVEITGAATSADFTVYAR